MVFGITCPHEVCRVLYECIQEIALTNPLHSPYSGNRAKALVCMANLFTDEKQSRNIYKTLFLSSHEAMAILGPSAWNFVAGNPTIIAMFGAKNEQEFLSYQAWKLSPSLQPDGQKSERKAFQHIEKALHDGSDFFEWVHRRITGEEFPANVLLSKIVIQGKEFLQAVVRDMSEQKKREREFQKLEEEKFKIVFQNAMDGILIADNATGKFLLANEAICTMLGYSSRELQQLSIDDIHPVESVPAVRKHIERIIQKKCRSISDIPMKRKDGSIFVADIHCSMIMLDGKACMLGMFRDVSERKNYEATLAASEEKYRVLVEQMNDGIFIIQSEKICFINDAFVRLAGYTQKEIVGRPFQDFLPPSFRELVTERYKKRQQGLDIPKTYEIQLLRKDGTTIDIMMTVDLIPYGNSVASMGILHDITEQKAREKTLFALSQRQKAILEAIPDIIMEVNNQKIYTWANDQGIAFFGDDVLGKTADYYFEGQQNVYEMVAPLFAGSEQATYIESWQRRKDGQKRLLAWWCRPLKDEKGNVIGALSSARDITEHLEMEQRIIQDKAQDEAILECIGDAVIACNKDGEIVLFNGMAEELVGVPAKKALGLHYGQVLRFRSEFSQEDNTDFIEVAMKKEKTTKMVNHTMLVRRDGRSIPVSNSAAPVKDASGTVIGCVVIFRNVSQEREVDRAKTEFVSLASHQLKTPLTVMNWYSEMLLANDHENLMPKQREYVQEMFRASRRMTGLINALLNVSRLELGTFTVEPENISVREVAQTCIKELSPLITARKLVFHEIYDPDVTTIFADKKLLGIVITNLLSNAIKYTALNGTIEFRVEKKLDGVVISVQDSGIGIPTDQQDKIFTKLFRANNAARIDPDGTGLGLYIVRAIMEASGGTVWFESHCDNTSEHKNCGTTFYIRLPSSGMKKKMGTKQLV